MKARVLTRKCLTIWWKKHLRGGQDGQDLQLDCGQSIESERRAWIWDHGQSGGQHCCYCRFIAALRKRGFNWGWGLATLACHQAVGKHSGRFRLVSAPIYFLVGTSSGASKDQPHPISRCSVNLAWVYISVHPRISFVVAGQCDHCYSGKVECSISWIQVSRLSRHQCVSNSLLLSLVWAGLSHVRSGENCGWGSVWWTFAGHQMGVFFRWDFFHNRMSPFFTCVLKRRGQDQMNGFWSDYGQVVGSSTAIITPVFLGEAPAVYRREWTCHIGYICNKSRLSVPGRNQLIAGLSTELGWIWCYLFGIALNNQQSSWQLWESSIYQITKDYP